MGLGTIKVGHLRKWLYFNGLYDYVKLNYIDIDYNEFTAIIYLRSMNVVHSVGYFANFNGWTSGYTTFIMWGDPFHDRYFYFGIQGETNKSILKYYPDLGKTKFFAGSYSKTNAVQKLYVDGNLYSQQSFNERIQPTNKPFLIGEYEYSGSFYRLLGNIYFAALYNRALSDEEVSQMYDYVVNEKGSMITDGLVLWLDGDSIDPDNSVWHDKSGNGNDGTIYGATYNSNIGVI